MQFRRIIPPTRNKLQHDVVERVTAFKRAFLNGWNDSIKWFNNNNKKKKGGEPRREKRWTRKYVSFEFCSLLIQWSGEVRGASSTDYAVRSFNSGCREK